MVPRDACDLTASVNTGARDERGAPTARSSPPSARQTAGDAARLFGWRLRLQLRRRLRCGLQWRRCAKAEKWNSLACAVRIGLAGLLNSRDAPTTNLPLPPSSEV